MAYGEETGTRPPTYAARRFVWVPLLLLGLVWCITVPVLTAQAVLTTATFFGEQPTATDHVEQHHHFTVALTVSAALVAVGLALSVLGRSTFGGWVFALLVIPTFVLGVLWLDTLPPEQPARPGSSSTATGGACQEYSGGDTRCPGG